jgi:hypothetical protein
LCFLTHSNISHLVLEQTYMLEELVGHLTPAKWSSWFSEFRTLNIIRADLYSLRPESKKYIYTNSRQAIPLKKCVILRVTTEISKQLLELLIWIFVSIKITAEKERNIQQFWCGLCWIISGCYCSYKVLEFWGKANDLYVVVVEVVRWWATSCKRRHICPLEWDPHAGIDPPHAPSLHRSGLRTHAETDQTGPLPRTSRQTPKHKQAQNTHACPARLRYDRRVSHRTLHTDSMRSDGKKKAKADANKYTCDFLLQTYPTKPKASIHPIGQARNTKQIPQSHSRNPI